VGIGTVDLEDFGLIKGGLHAQGAEGAAAGRIRPTGDGLEAGWQGEALPTMPVVSQAQASHHRNHLLFAWASACASLL
jgi:hypothetical protein